MKISGKRDYLFNLENTAITDIVMNLFIFFFISFSLLYTFKALKIEEIKIKLPKADNSSDILHKKVIDVSVSGQKEIFINGKKVEPAGLRRAVEEFTAEGNNLPVILHADVSVPFGDIAGVLDILSGSPVSGISLAMEKAKTKVSK